MIYLHEDFANHPKIIRAGAAVGGDNGRASAISVYVGGLGYARKFLTDGIVPAEYLETSGLAAHPLTVAAALCRANLWHKCPRGFRIHDYHDHNRTASQVKRARRQWREAKKRQRHGNNGEFKRTGTRR